ncbi:DNA/RNA non-specific endonuclease [Massilia sp.]|uniref:DNA/RNA non-specific endonuclease n=1 Tax=Massilia sp. TaxID=1882437 RepID=UPI00352F007C
MAATPKPASYFKGRTGYRPDFLGDGSAVALPALSEDLLADVAKLDDGSYELRYEHFSTAQSMSRRMPLFSACNVDGASGKSLPRYDTWSYDGRIDKQYQMLREACGDQGEQKFSRGHMTRRQDPNWGALETAQQANIDTFTATNVCPQWQPFNDGLWGDLEDYILLNAQGDSKRVSVITGPFLRPDDPKRFEILVPRDFWKVVAFISEATGQLSCIAYMMSQGEYLDTGVANDLEDFKLSQRPLSYIEQHTGLTFTDLAGKDVFDGVDLTFVQPIRRVGDTKLAA